MKIISLIVAAAVLFLYSDAHSQNSYGNGLGAGLQLGYQKARDAENGSYLIGAMLRMKPSQSLGIEGSINYRNEEYANGSINIRNWPVMASLMIYPIPIVYGVAGGGWYYTTIDYDNDLESLGFDDKTTNKFGWHLGGGLELPLAPGVSLTGDIRYVFLDYKIGNMPRVKNVKSDFYYITLGLIFGL